VAESSLKNHQGQAVLSSEDHHRQAGLRPEDHQPQAALSPEHHQPHAGLSPEDHKPQVGWQQLFLFSALIFFNLLFMFGLQEAFSSFWKNPNSKLYSI
jgi:hypothetical protein